VVGRGVDLEKKRRDHDLHSYKCPQKRSRKIKKGRRKSVLVLLDGQDVHIVRKKRILSGSGRCHPKDSRKKKGSHTKISGNVLRRRLGKKDRRTKHIAVDRGQSYARRSLPL